ncbi:MAG: oligoendopeptidase F [Firmicutes bacterium]|nr:oligoendopeptidase F [Bacillota bacterium]MDY2720251.1 oligoendopeptidase F [Candidatus Faecousia sp.]
MIDTKKTPERKDVAPENLWAINDLYATDDDCRKDLARLKALAEELSGYAGKLGSDAATLLTYLTKVEEAMLLLNNTINYAARKNDEDTRVGTYQELNGMAMSTYVQLQSATAFETPEIMAIDDETLERFYREEAGLEKYRRYLFNIRRHKDHVLTPAEEKLLAAAGEMMQSPDDIYSKFADADLTFPDVVDKDGNKHHLTQGTYISYMESSDRVLRKSAFEQNYSTWGAYRNTFASILNAQVKSLQFNADARKYGSSLEAALDGTNVPVSVYHNLIEAVHQNMDKMYRYVDLRKKLLGVDELHFYDLYTPLVTGVDKKIPFEQAKQTVYNALAPMGDYYRSILKEGFDNRWIDVYENVGKRSGAYSAGAMVHPYVLLNYTGTLDSQFTLAHEMGHAIHSYLSNKNQPTVYSDYVIFVAEVASTCNEALLMQYLLDRTTDRKERAYLINHFLEQFRTTLYRQTMFAEFEMILGNLNQQGVALTAERMCEEYKKLNHLYFGDGIVLDDLIAYEWERIPHFYYNYYVFQYATGYSAAIALSRKILKEGESAVKDYLQFLSGGCSKDPIDLLKGAGVDMSTPEPVNQALALFGDLLDEMEALMQE